MRKTKNFYARRLVEIFTKELGEPHCYYINQNKNSYSVKFIGKYSKDEVQNVLEAWAREVGIVGVVPVKVTNGYGGCRALPFTTFSGIPFNTEETA